MGTSHTRSARGLQDGGAQRGAAVPLCQGLPSHLTPLTMLANFVQVLSIWMANVEVTLSMETPFTMTTWSPVLREEAGSQGGGPRPWCPRPLPQCPTLGPSLPGPQRPGSNSLSRVSQRHQFFWASVSSSVKRGPVLDATIIIKRNHRTEAVVITGLSSPPFLLSMPSSCCSPRSLSVFQNLSLGSPGGAAV